MTIEYRPTGVCSQHMSIEVDGGIIRSVRVRGGCSGNLQGVSRLVEGMTVQEAIRRMEGIQCGDKDTSCPDQMTKALRKSVARSGG